MTEVSGQPIVNKSDSVGASYLKAQDFFMNPPGGGDFAVSFNNAPGVPTSGGLSGFPGNLNFATSFTASGRVNTTAGSGPFAPLGFFSIKVSGNPVVVPFFQI